jgi:signal transduction histidine kinase
MRAMSALMPRAPGRDTRAIAEGRRRSSPLLAAGAAGLIVLLLAAPADRRASAAALGDGPEPARVLLMFDEDRALPGLAALEQGLRSTFLAGLGHVEFYSESLNLSQFDDDGYEERLGSHYREKYRARRPHLIVAVMGPSLRFLLRRGEAAFPGVPVVFCGADAADLGTGPLPDRMTGLLLRRTFAPTFDLALRLQPATSHVYVVGGTSAFDRHLQESAQREFQPYERRVAIHYLTDLGAGDLLAAVSRLPANSAVLYLSMFRDGAGNAFVPHEVAARLSAAAAAPVYVFVDQYVGRGPLGGHVYSLQSHGERTAGIGLRVLRGERPATIPVSAFEGTRTVLDARQLERWGIDERLLPPDAALEFRAPSLWRDYRGAVLAVLGIGFVQLGLIVGLAYQRRARRRAVRRSRQQLMITAHLGRQLAMGELATAIAHELNQPLAAIRLNAAAAGRLLRSNRDAVEEIIDILDDIAREDARAGQIIRRQRAMLQKKELEQRPLDLNAVVGESLAIVAHDAESRRVRIEARLCGEPCAVTGDQILLQQVMVNLIVNAMDAMGGTPPADRRVVVQTVMTRHVAEVSVQDRGHGIAADVAGRLFDPFVTTKRNGMGIGLAIVRGIVEEHGGTVQARNNADGGATFWFALPSIGSERVEAAAEPTVGEASA